MGQKMNPNLFQLIKNKKWKSKYLEKKNVESSIYSRKDEEIRLFLFRFFKTYHISIHNCHLYHLKNSLHISFSYYAESNKYYLKIKKEEDKMKMKYIRTYRFSQIKTLRVVGDKKSEIYFKTQQVLFQRCFNYSYLYTKFLLKKLSINLASYLGKNCKIFLILKDLKFKTRKIALNTMFKKLLVKNIGSLRKYQRSNFFKKGINLLFNCVVNKNSSELLAWFIGVQLKKLKRHNFFIRFVENTLKLFKSSFFSNFKGMQIKIKGRLNGRPRARSKNIIIGKSISNSTLDSIIDYSEKTAFTSNGTIGVKVWIQQTLFE